MVMKKKEPLNREGKQANPGGPDTSLNKLIGVFFMIHRGLFGI